MANDVTNNINVFVKHIGENGLLAICHRSCLYALTYISHLPFLAP